VLGINIRIALYRIPTTAVFWEAAGGMLGGAAALFAVAMVCYRRNGILR
jgi:magnesium transporter